MFAVHPIRAELDRPSDVSSTVRISLVLCVAIYTAVGFSSYLLFGDSIMADVLVNFDKTSDNVITTILDYIVKLSDPFHLMLVFPVVNNSLRANVDELFFPKRPLLAAENLRFYCLTSTLLVFIYVAAIAIPIIWYLFQIIRTTTVVCLAFVSTRSIILRDVRCISSNRDKALAVFVILLAVGTGLLAIFQICLTILAYKDECKYDGAVYVSTSMS